MFSWKLWLVEESLRTPWGCYEDYVSFPPTLWSRVIIFKKCLSATFCDSVLLPFSLVYWKTWRDCLLNGPWKYSRVHLCMFCSFQLYFVKCKFIKVRVYVLSFWFTIAFGQWWDFLKHIECLRYNQIEIPFQMKVNVYFYYV